MQTNTPRFAAPSSATASEENMKQKLRKIAFPCFRVLILCGLICMTNPGPLSAQLGTATISGNVTDSSGAVIVGAAIKAVNNGTAFVRQTTSNQQGQYNLPG